MWLEYIPFLAQNHKQAFEVQKKMFKDTNKKNFLTDEQIEKMSDKELNVRIGILQKKTKSNKRLKNFRDIFPNKKVSYSKSKPVSEGLIKFSKQVKVLRRL